MLCCKSCVADAIQSIPSTDGWDVCMQFRKLHLALPYMVWFARRCGSKVDNGVSEVMKEHDFNYGFPQLLAMEDQPASTIAPDDEQGQEGGAESGQHGSGVSGLTPSEMAKMNAKRRRVALEWLAQEPFSMVLLFLHCLEPMACLLEQYIGRSGDIHLQKGRAEVARVLMTHDDGNGMGGEGPAKTSYQAFVEQVSGVLHEVVTDMSAQCLDTLSQRRL
eukprot:6468260-Amphidinium_carterae.2